MVLNSALVVDDDPSIREAIVLLLEDMGVPHVSEAGDGVQAIEALNGPTPDVMVLDLMMPRMDGIEVLRAIRMGKTTGRPHRIIVLSAYIDHSAASQLKSLGADAWINKPFSLDELQRAILAPAMSVGL